MRLRLTRRAVADLQQAERWYTQAGAGREAARRLARIKTAINALAVNPWLGRADQLQGVRRLARHGHVIIYTVSPAERGSDQVRIVIVRLLGPGKQS